MLPAIEYLKIFYYDLQDELGEKEITFDRVTDTELQYHEYFKECVDSAKKLCSIPLILIKLIFGQLAVSNYISYSGDELSALAIFKNKTYFLLDDDELIAISAVLKDTQIKKLYLHFNKFSVNGLLAFSSALKESKIEVLSLSFNYVTNNRINMLADALPFTHVTSLHLAVFDVDFSCWTHLFDTLSSTKITVLCLEECHLEDKGIKYLSTKLDNSKIKCLNLDNNSISYDGLKSLADVLENTAITHLFISHNEIGFTGTKYLAEKLSKSVLQSLDIGHNKIESEGCLAIGNVIHLTQIISLDLDENSIDSSGITSLAENLKKSNVKYLNLNENNLGINGAQILANELKDSQLESLNVNSNQLTNVGMGIILDALEFTKITDFDLDCTSNEMGKENMKLLTNAFQFLKLKKLNLKLPQNEDVVRLFFNELKTLIESNTNNEILFIKNKMNFSLDLDFGIITDGVKYIFDVTKHFHMEKLCLNNLKVDLLVQIPSIVDILIDIKYPISNTTTLILNDNNLGDIGAGILAENFKYLKLTRLELDKTQIKNDGVIAIAKELKNSQIRYLDLANNSFDSIAASYLTNVVKNHPVRIRLNYLVENGFSAEDQLVIKNNNLMFLRAQWLITSINDNSPVKYDKDSIEYLKAYEIFKNVDLLWESQIYIEESKFDYHRIDSEIRSKVTMNFLKIIGVVNSDEIISDLLPTELIILICSYLKINDVKIN